MKCFVFAITNSSASIVTCSAAEKPQASKAIRNRPPSITIVAPHPESLFRGFRTYFRAEASDIDGFVRRVEFFSGPQLIGADEKAPHMVAYQPSTHGNIRVSAVAWDDDGASTTSVTAFAVRECPSGQSCAAELAADDMECCIELPVVHWVAPKPNRHHSAPATITLEATASIADDTISAVEFFDNGRLIGTVTKPPFRYRWNEVQAGTYVVTARARTQHGLIGESAVNTIAVEKH